MEHVIINDPTRMNLLGLFLANIIGRNLEQPEQLKRLSKVKGSINVFAGAMTVALSFSEGALTVSREPLQGANAQVSGTMDALMGMALGRSMVGMVLSGRIKIKGNPFLLLKIKPLLMAAKAA